MRDPALVTVVPLLQRFTVGGLLAVTLAVTLALGMAMDPVETRAAEEGDSRSTEAELPTAPVVIDGHALFRVRGTTTFPPEKRAAGIANRIRAAAADRAVPLDAVRTAETDPGTTIVAGSHRLMLVVDADARLESLERRVLAAGIARVVREAIAEYRQSRSREALVRATALTGVATAILAALVALVVWSFRRTQALLHARYRERVQSVGIQSFQIVRAEQIWTALRRLLALARVGVILALGFVYLQYVLGMFPWTRGASNQLLQYVVHPLQVMGWGLANAAPDIVFLVILFVITRAVLKLIHLFFAAIGRGEVRLSGFDREWSDPTYKLLRLAVVALALVVAYPYIPGSSSEAFKGISIFMGIVFSLGSSSAVANVIAGYTMTYRRAFRRGDRVKIGDTMGDVTEVRLQVTRLKTIKNEEVIIPNSTILNNDVVNYSALARDPGLILHTRVGIGYETPWRQVEALLLIAAERTAGLLKEPKPFVRQLALGDFAVTYEINGYCNDPQAMGQIYTDLHRNILDLFNEHGVQIMTPAYEGDPEVPKVVPKDQWFTAPAKDTAALEARNP